MRLKFLALIILFLQLVQTQALAEEFQRYLGFDPAHFTVKVHSRHLESSDYENEGTGLVFRSPGSVFVVTALHAVIPCEYATEHLAYFDNGKSVQMRLVGMSEKMGLALFQVHPWEYSNDFIKYFEQSRIPGIWDYVFHFNEPTGPISAYGYPVGSYTLRDLHGGTLSQFNLSEGYPTFDVEHPIIRIDGLLTEFGFSGGPLFQGQDLIGLISHRLENEKESTYAIHAHAVAMWVVDNGVKNINKDACSDPFFIPPKKQTMKAAPAQSLDDESEY